MPRPVIAIAGSVNPARADELSLTDVDTAAEACRELGSELALAGCDLLIFSGKPGYVEPAVVRGYVEAADPSTPGRVIFRAPRHRSDTVEISGDSAVTLDVEPDTSAEWEVSFYRSILGADGFLLIGGGQTTRVAGTIALAQNVPVAPVASFGGAAAQVWIQLDKVRNDVGADEIPMLAAPWRPGSAATVVGCLVEQGTRRRDRARAAAAAERATARRGGIGLSVACAALAAALACIPLTGGPGAPNARALTMLLLAPMLAAVAGAVIRESFNVDQGWPRAAVRGFGAGAVTVLLYVAAQVLALPDLLEQLDARRLLFFVIPLGFTAGFTFDLVFERLRSGQPAETPPVPER